MSRKEEIKRKQRHYYGVAQACDDLMQVHLGDISLTLAKICDSMERIAGYLESPYTVTIGEVADED